MPPSDGGTTGTGGGGAPSLLRGGAPGGASDTQPGGGAPGATDAGAGGGAGGTPGATDDRAWLPDDYRSDPAFADYKDVAGVLKSHKSLIGMLGLDKNLVLKIPKAADDQEGWNGVYKALGRPDAADGYELDALDGADDAAMNGLRGELHKLGLSQPQAKGLIGYYAGLQQAAAQRAAAQAVADAQAAETTLQKEWGAANYKANIDMAIGVVRRFGGDEALTALQNSPASRDPAVLKMLVAIGGRLGEPGLGGGGNGGGGPSGDGGMSPAEAQAALTAMQSDKASQDALFTSTHPMHKTMVERFHTLKALARGEKPA